MDNVGMPTDELGRRIEIGMWVKLDAAFDAPPVRVGTRRGRVEATRTGEVAVVFLADGGGGVWVPAGSVRIIRGSGDEVTPAVLNEREINVLVAMKTARIADIQRKRSWRHSEKAMAIAETQRLADKIVAAMKQGEQG